MQTSVVRVTSRKNLGNYEHKEVDITVALVEGDCGEKALSECERLIAIGLGETAPVKKASVKTSSTPTPAKKEPTTTTTKKAPAKKAPARSTATKEQVLEALKEYAKAKKDKNAAVSVMEDVTGKTKLADVEVKEYAKLLKALKV